MYTRFFLQLNQFPKLIMLAALLISFFFFDQVRQKLFDQSSGELIIDSTVEPFIERSSGAYQEFLEVRDAFGNEDVLVVALHQPQTGVGLDFINTLADISHEVRKNIPGVIAVTSLLDIPRPPGTCSGKSYFHTLQPGSVCVSLLERYRHARQCILDGPPAGIEDGSQGESMAFDPVEGEEEFEAELDALPQNELDPSLDEEPEGQETVSEFRESESPEAPDTEILSAQIASPDGQRTAEELRQAGWLCTEDLYEQDEQEIHADFDRKIRTSMEELAGNPLMEGDLVSVDLKTAALVIRFSSDVLPSDSEIQEPLLQVFEEQKTKLGILEKNKNPGFRFALVKKDSQPGIGEGFLQRLKQPAWISEKSLFPSSISKNKGTPEANPSSSQNNGLEDQTITSDQQKILEEDPEFPLRIAFAGQSRQVFEASKLIRNDVKTILPLSLLLIIIVLALSFRSMRTVTVPLLMVMLGVLWTAGMLALIGDKLNLVTMACAPIVICVGSAYVIKLINEYQMQYREALMALTHSEETLDRQRVVENTIAKVAVPVSVTALTTVSGFAALMVSPIPAVKELGLYSSIGIIVINLFALTLAPSILRYLQIPVPSVFSLQGDSMNFLLGFLKKWIRRNSKQIIRFWIVFTALVALGMIWLQINSSTRSFPEDSPVIRDLDLVENELAGTDTLRLVFRAPEEKAEGAKGANPLKTAKTMLGLEKLQQWLEQQGSLNELSEIQGLQIDKVYSPVTYLDYYRSGMDRLTDTEVERFFADMRNNEGPAFLDEKEQLLLVTMRMRVSGSTAFLELRELLKEKIPRMLPHLSVSFTGGQVLTSESANNIAQGQIQSVFLALAVIFVILSSLFLSWKMGVIALFPNIVAVLIFFGTMGWLSIPIGVTISVIAAIALGIGVDDTIHFLSHYNETAKHLRDKREASMATLPHVVRPMILTTIALSAGFILFVLSDMESQILFGTLTAFTLIVCLATDMTFLPSVVMETGMITVWDYVGLKFNKEFVQKIDLFKNMSVREAKIATLMSFTVDLKEDEVLFRQGDMGREMFVVLDGQIRIYLEQGYETTELALLEKGTTFGEMGLFRGAQRSAGAVASQPSKMLVINHDSLIRLRKRNPKIAAKLFLNLAMRLENSYRQTNQKILDGLVKSENFGTDLKGRFNRKFTDLFSDISEKNQKKWIQGSTRIPMTAEGILDAIELDQNSWLIMLSGKIEIRCFREGSYQQLAIRNAGDLLCRAEMLVPTGDSKIELHALEASEILCVTAEQLEMLQRKEVRLTAQWTEELVCVLSDQVEEANTYLKFTV